LLEPEEELGGFEGELGGEGDGGIGDEGAEVEENDAAADEAEIAAQAEVGVVNALAAVGGE